MSQLTIQRRVEPAIPGTDHYALLTKAAAQWRKASLDPINNMPLCENTARELEIERDLGQIVYLNTRIS